MRLPLVLASLVVLGLAWPATSRADHVTATVAITAQLAERASDTAWIVEVRWSISCNGPAGAATYGGDHNLIDEDTNERIYLGGTASQTGTTRQAVGRRATDRRVKPHIKAYCGDADLTKPHGSGPVEATGNTVLVPRRGVGDPAPTPTPAPGPTGPGGAPPGVACATLTRGTDADERLTGTSAGDRLLGLGGEDFLFGLGGDDCLEGGPGNDRLLGSDGADRLGGGAGRDDLRGGGGSDRLDGGRGVDRYSGGGGADRIDARDGRRERVRCGRGRDVARVDRRDVVGGCERVLRPS